MKSGSPLAGENVMHNSFGSLVLTELKGRRASSVLKRECCDQFQLIYISSVGAITAGL